MTFEEIWTAIKKDNSQGSGAGIIRRRVLANACCDLFLGLEKPSGMRILLLRIANPDAPDISILPRARGFEVRMLALPDDPAGYSSVLLSQTNASFRDIFTTLAEDVAEHVASASNQKAAADEFLVRLKRWQKFLEKSGPDGLGEEAQRGLFGELWFIRDYLLPTLGPGSIAAWTGPSLSPQDFQFPGFAVETKVTTAREHQIMRIAGEKQLENSSALRIYLFHLSLSSQRDTGLSLTGLVSEIRTILASHPMASSSFEDSLLAAGWLDAHAQRYNQPGYLRREHHFFEVRDVFPRIVGGDLREGVGDVAYSIGVSACSSYVLRESDFLSILTGARP